jgi:DNA modification methylase
MTVRIINADVMEGLRQLPDESVHCIVTSPPYFGLRDYGVDGQIGLEATPEAFVARMVEVFAEARRVLRGDGTCWLNLGDSYAGGKTGRDDEDEENLRRRFEAFGTGRPKAGRKGANGVQRPVPRGFKAKDLMGMPWMVAFALRADGWYLRRDIIWHKPNPMPESVTDRCTSAHEYVFMLTKRATYYYDAEAIKESVAESQVGRVRADPIGGKSWAERGQHSSGGVYISGDRKAMRSDRESRHRSSIPGGQSLQAEPDGQRNKRSVWTVATAPFADAHFATFPPGLIEPMILAGCPKGGTVLDPFSGAGTTALVADRLQRNAIGIELNPEYAAMSEKRINGDRGGLLDLMEAIG